MASAKKRRLLAAADAAFAFESASAFAINNRGDDLMATTTTTTAVAADVGMVPAPPSTSTSAAAPPTIEGGNYGDDDEERKRIIVTRLLDLHVETVNSIRRDVSALLLASGRAAATTTTDDAANIEKRAASISISLSKLKSLQRLIILRAEMSYAESRRHRDVCDNLGLALMNVTYERDYLRDEIAEVGGWRATSLESMALGELGIDIGAFDNDGMGAKLIARSGVPPTTAVSSSFEEGEEVEGREGDEIRGRGVASANARDIGSGITTLEGAIDAYLFGNDENDVTTMMSEDEREMTDTKGKRSHRDPSEHAYVIEKLTSDLNTRANLVERLSKAKLELRGMIKRRDELLGLLDKLPAKLAELRKAGQGLNSLFFGGNVGVWRDVLLDVGGGGGGGYDDDNDNDMIIDGGDGGGDGERATTDVVSAANLLVCRPSFDRTERFRLAKSNLPSPLYVLYVQLAGYIDAWSSLERSGEGRGIMTTAAGIFNTIDASSSSSSSSFPNISHRGFVGAGGMDVSVIPPSECGDGGGWSVALTLTPSEVVPSEVSSLLGKSNSNPRSWLVTTMAAVVKVLFSIDVMHGLVRAMLVDGGDGYDGLLDNLFPGDDGLYNPNVSLSLLSHNEDGNANDGEKDRANGGRTIDDNCNGGGVGKPYYWCQVLGGLDFPPPPSAVATPSSARDDAERNDAPFPIETCTRAVFRQLLRRIRARSTLVVILEYLGKRGNHHTLPVHPAMRREGGGVVVHPQSLRAKLHSWGEDSRPDRPNLSGPASAATKSYTAIIKRKSSTLKATVVIDAHNYPAKPPLWSLMNEDGSSGTLSSWGEENGSVFSLQQQHNPNNDTMGIPPLFDAALHRIACRVNLDLDGFVRQDVETTYDWILIHQLADIVSCWDEVMSATEGSVGVAGAKGRNEVGRTRRGKDRRIVGFGERSPFFWYRNGL